MSRAAIEQALEALQCSEPRRGFTCTCQGSKRWPSCRCRWQQHQDAIAALRAALAQQAQPLTIERLRAALVAARVIPPEAVEDADNYDDGVMLGRIEALHRRIA